MAAAGYEARIHLEPLQDPLQRGQDDVVGTARAVGMAMGRGDPAEALRRVAALASSVRRVPAGQREGRLRRDPGSTGDPRWDALLAGVVEHVCHLHDLPTPAWTREPDRFLDRFWFVIETILGRPAPELAISAFVESPAALSNRGVFLHPASLVSV